MNGQRSDMEINHFSWPKMLYPGDGVAHFRWHLQVSCAGKHKRVSQAAGPFMCPGTQPPNAQASQHPQCCDSSGWLHVRPLILAGFSLSRVLVHALPMSGLYLLISMALYVCCRHANTRHQTKEEDREQASDTAHTIVTTDRCLDGVPRSTWQPHEPSLFRSQSHNANAGCCAVGPRKTSSADCHVVGHHSYWSPYYGITST
jgi:hypothetical protein